MKPFDGLAQPDIAGELGCMCAEVHPRAGNICKGCRAKEVGRNCWEMTVSPCCDRPRDACKTCLVYANAMKGLSSRERVCIMLDGGTILDGEVTVRQNQRVSDLFNDPSLDYVAVTGVRVSYPASAGRPDDLREAVLVSKRAAVLITPLGSAATCEEPLDVPEQQTKAG